MLESHFPVTGLSHKSGLVNGLKHSPPHGRLLPCVQFDLKYDLSSHVGEVRMALELLHALRSVTA